MPKAEEAFSSKVPWHYFPTLFIVVAKCLECKTSDEKAKG